MILNDLKDFVSRFSFLPFEKRQTLIAELESLSPEELLKLLNGWEQTFSSEILKKKVREIRTDLINAKIICECMEDLC